MTKPPLWNTSQGSRHVTCCYCERQLQTRNRDATDGLTFDHVRAESDGGWKKVPCCRKCNFLKDNLPPDDWFWFIATHPRWWKEFANPSQVKRVVREFRFGQAQAGARPHRRIKDHMPFLGHYGGNQ